MYNGPGRLYGFEDHEMTATITSRLARDYGGTPIRTIGEGEAGTGRQILDAALALPEMFEQFEPMRMG
jgi:hypothetical protein